MNAKKVAIIILNWNGVQFLENCLTSATQQTYPNFDCYVVDNGSTDESVQFITQKYPQVKILQLASNTGFACGNNIGIQKALKDPEVEYIFTLNNDTKLDKECLLHLIQTAETSPTIGAVAPKMMFFYEPGLIDSIGILVSPDGGGINRGHKEKDTGQYNTSEEVFGVCAGAALYKRKALEEIAYHNEFFDNSFFLYLEDIDLNWRLRLMGWKTVTCPDALVLHIHSATNISYSPLKAYYVNRNRYFLIIKNFPLRYLMMALLLTPYRYIQLLNSMFVKKSGPSYQLKSKSSNAFEPFFIVLKGFASLLYHIPLLIKKRRHIQKNKKVLSQNVGNWLHTYKANVNT